MDKEKPTLAKPKIVKQAVGRAESLDIYYTLTLSQQTICKLAEKNSKSVALRSSSRQSSRLISLARLRS